MFITSIITVNHRPAKHSLSYNYGHPESYFLHSTGIVPRQHSFGSLNRNLKVNSSFLRKLALLFWILLTTFSITSLFPLPPQQEPGADWTTKKHISSHFIKPLAPVSGQEWQMYFSFVLIWMSWFFF